MNVKGIGIDIVSIKRFTRFVTKPTDRFLVRTFSPRELSYCFAFRDPAVHLAGTFAGKEAVWKSLARDDIIFSSIEIRRGRTGMPAVWIKNRQQTSVQVSITHTNTIAIAIAIRS